MKVNSQLEVFINNCYQEGQKAIQLGLFKQAEQHFSAIIKIDPNILEVRTALAYVYAASKQHAKASSELKLILKSNPNNPQTLFNLANSLYEQKLYADALQYYKTAIELDPNFVNAHIHYGIAYRMLKDHDAAITCLHKALDLDNENARAFHVLGMVYVDIEDYNRALHYLESACGLAPQNADFRVSFASVLEKASLDTEAGYEYHNACEVDPNYLDAFTTYGKYLLKNHRYDEALECIKHAEKLSPKNLNVTDLLGLVYSGMSNTDAAITQYRSALETEPERLSSLIGLSQVYLELGDTTKGIEVCDEIIAIDKNLTKGYIQKASMGKSMPSDGLAEQLLRFTENGSSEDKTKAETHFVLGKIYDDQNNYTQAFKHYTFGNNIKNKSSHYDIERNEANISKLMEIYSADLFKTHQNLGVDSKMPVIIIGMPRSGTTLTEQIISSHPKVIGAGEVMFWSRTPTAMPLRLGTDTPYPECVREISPEQAEDIATMYESTLQKIAGVETNPEHITDKMPHNFIHLGLIALLFPNVKIIHTKRNPIDTCLSIFFQNFNAAHDYASDLSNLGFHYKQYQRIMRHWHEVLPGRILDINYEDTIADPQYWSRKLINHIGLEWDDACLAPHKLERSVKTASHWQVRQPIYKTSVERWKNYEEFLQPLIEALKD